MRSGSGANRGAGGGFARRPQAAREQSAQFDRDFRMLSTQLLEDRGAQERDARVLERRDPWPRHPLAAKRDLTEARRRRQGVVAVAMRDRERAGLQDEQILPASSAAITSSPARYVRTWTDRATSATMSNGT